MPISYILKRSRRKTITLKIADGRLYVLAPLFASESQIEKMIEDHQSWIAKKMSNPPINVHFDLMKDKYIYFAGKQYRLVVLLNKPDSIQFQEDYLILQGKTFATIEKNYRNFLIDFLSQKVESQRKRLQKDFTYSFRKYKSKWGCCYPKKKYIVLNIFLACVEEKAIDGVICHEIAHLNVSNHQKAFYQHLATLDSSYLESAKTLKRYSIQ